MTQVKNLWLNEYDNISMWEMNGLYSVRIQSPTLENGFTGVETTTIYDMPRRVKWYSRKKADAIWDAEVSKWN